MSDELILDCIALGIRAVCGTLMTVSSTILKKNKWARLSGAISLLSKKRNQGRHFPFEIQVKFEVQMKHQLRA